MTVRTEPVRANVTMVVTAPLMHLCPFKDEVDRGDVKITWTTNGNTFELHSLRAYLGAFADLTITHEDLTEQIRRELGAFHGVHNVTVQTSWETAGMGVVCST
jgi:NADPH-dependent 7-cyano-7-deazaguanine reductase QueF